MIRRYSEIPSTPTPHFRGKSPELRIGAKLNIPNIGRSILRYIGPIDNKSGEFAGIELIGDDINLGKNNGDVNGKKYFNVEKKGNGLFLTYEKLLNLLNESPSKLYSPVLSSRKSFAVPSSATKPKTTASATPFRNIGNKENNLIKSPIEAEFQKALTDKSVIENQNEILQQEMNSLNLQIIELNAKLKNNESVIKDLELKSRQFQLHLDSSNERVNNAENKLIKQRKLYDEQRKELLDVIDQLEAQVDDNEKLYLGELAKLQQEIEQNRSSSEIIQNLELKLKNSEIELKEIIKKKDDEIQSLNEKLVKFDELKKENDELNKKLIASSKAVSNDDEIFELEMKLENKEKIINDLRNDLLNNDKERVSKPLRDEINSLEKQLDMKKDEIELLNKKLLEKGDDSKDKTKIAELEKIINDYKLKDDEHERLLKQMEELKIENQIHVEKEAERVKLEEQLSELQTQLANVKPQDSLMIEEQKLEIELLNEEIQELKSQIETKQVENANSDKIAELQAEIEQLNNRPTLEDYEILKQEVSASVTTAQAKDDEIKELNVKLKALQNLKSLTVSIPNSPIGGSPKLESPRSANRQTLDGTNRSLSNLSFNRRPSIISQIIDGELQVYVPEKKSDPTNGRKLWCGLCEREGHESIDCPYENDVF